ncbi:glycerol-3-phosphate dehydrogenase C-terminal domain-containing protein [Nocardioides sp. TF02-7]|uniref:glycerol-3-phosphate dehydrogenase C-terminal domain-containing protein n=1 Tax=Nocardioides sp. TF02-7 TaxID=2917724 RepID=UPI0031F4CC5D
MLGRKPGPCVTEDVPLVGADGYQALRNQRRTLAARSGLAVNRVDHLLDRYGSLVLEVLDIVAAEPELGEPLPGAEDYLRVEAVYAVTHEGARHLDDILTRRLRVSIETFDRGVAAAPHVADLVRGHLGWDAAQRDREIDHYLKRVEAERESQRQPDDQTADAARKGAPDVVPVSHVAEAIEGAP